MLRNVNLNEVSDGRLYDSNDMVKAECGDCIGCHKCCTGMGSSIVLDPLDIARLTKGLGKTFEQLLTDSVELNVVDGVILPNIKMQEGKDACIFLDENGRCSIHKDRPGICRIFPLGRFYEENGFKYFLQVHECERAGKTKVKISKWIDTPNQKQYEKYINDWHNFQKFMQGLVVAKASELNDDEKLHEYSRTINMTMLNVMFMSLYREEEDFYSQFYSRLEKLTEILKLQ